jgi:hypothetical protein
MRDLVKEMIRNIIFLNNTTATKYMGGSYDTIYVPKDVLRFWTGFLFNNVLIIL